VLRVAVLSARCMIARASAAHGVRGVATDGRHNTDEDVALGFWLSRYHRAGVARVTYVKANEKLTNLGCKRSSGLYRAPRNRSVGVHFVKTAGGMQYVWRVIVDGLRPNASLCHIMTGDYRL
jgi:hypothetical protein